MSRSAFRQDRWLRSIGYQLLVWGAAHALWSVPWWRARYGDPWSATVVLAWVLLVAAAGVLLSLVSDNRVAKMCGPANEPFVDAGRLWACVLVAGGAGVGVVAGSGSEIPLAAIWVLALGAGFLLWGAFTVVELRWLGALLVAGGAATVVASSSLPSPALLLSWLLFTGALWLPFAVRINRKYLYVRPAPPGEGRREPDRSGGSARPSSRSPGSHGR